MKVSPVELSVFANNRHSPLRSPKMSDQPGTLPYHSIFRVTNSDSSMYCAYVVNFKLKVQIVNDLLGKNFFSKIILILPYAKTQDFHKEFHFELA